MSDGLPKELSRGEQVFINSVVHDPPQWIRWVKKTNPKNSIQLRLMVITKYRVYSIKRNKMGKKQIVREGHLYDLREVSTDDLDRCVLVFKDFKIVAFAPNLGVDLPRVVLQCFYNISYTFSEAASPKLTILPAERNPPIIERTPPGPAAGFEEVYLAQCDYLGATSSQDIIILVDDLHASGVTALDLDQCTGIEKDNPYALNLAPIIAALRHNNYFTSFSLHDKSRKEIVAGLADILTHNITLTSIDISGVECSSEEAWTAFGEAFKQNPHNRIQNINVSNNALGEKGIIPFTAGLASITHPMSSIQIADTGLQAKGITQFFRTLVGNATLSNTVQEISVSGNPIPGGPLSVAPGDWILTLNENQPGTDKKYLRKVCLGSCAIDVPPVIDAIRSVLFNTIEYIDFSGNKLEEYAIQILSSLVTKATSLSHLSLTNCSLTGALMAMVIQGATLNPGLPQNFVLDLSQNDLSKEDQGVIGLAGAIATCKSIHTLRIGELNMKKEVLIPLLKGIGENSSLQGIDLSGNFKHGQYSAAKGENPLDVLVASIKAHPTLTYFGCAGRKDNQLQKDIIPVFKVLVDNMKLWEFDVSNNNFGDDGARELFDTLRTNYCLKSLSFDRNNITYPGWQALRRCILVNRSLVDLKYPKKDITKTIMAEKDKERPEMHEKLREMFIEVSIFTNNNLTNTADARPLQPSPKPPVLLPPYELFLSTPSNTAVTPGAYATPYINNGSPAVSRESSVYNAAPRDSVYAAPPREASVYGAPPMSPPPPAPLSPPPREASVYGAPPMAPPPPAPLASPPPPPGAYSVGAADPRASVYIENGGWDYSPNGYSAAPPPPAPYGSSATLNGSGGYGMPPPPEKPGINRPVSMAPSPSTVRSPPLPPVHHMTVSYGAPPSLSPPPPLSPPPLPPAHHNTVSYGAPPHLTPPPSFSNLPPLPNSPYGSNSVARSVSAKNLPPVPPTPLPPTPPTSVTARAPPPPPAEPYPDDLGTEESGDYDYQYSNNNGNGEEFEDLTPANQINRNPPPPPVYNF